MTENKKCIKCEEYKSLDNFNKHKHSRDGRDCYCKQCRIKIHKSTYVYTGGRRGPLKGCKIKRKNPMTGINITYDENFIIDWVNNIKEIGLYVPYKVKNPIKYENTRSFISSVGIKLDSNSKKLFNYYYKKEIDKEKFRCKHCGDEITKEHFINVFSKYSESILWCEKCYKDKVWIGETNRRMVLDPEYVKKRAESRNRWLNTEEGIAYKNHVGECNRINTKRWKSKQSDEEKIITNNKSSASQIKNILEGKFNPQKNYNHYVKNICWINDQEYVFRSSWEVIFFISHPDLEYENIRIPYLKDGEKKGIYIPDFIDQENKLIYELKPRRNFIKQQKKMNAGIEWSLNNGYKFIWVNEDNLMKYINEDDNKDSRNKQFYLKAYKGINGNITNKINKENRKY